MVEKKRHPEKELVGLIILVAVVFACVSFVKNMMLTAYAVQNNAMPDSSFSCDSIPLATYTLLLISLIILITYLVRKHFAYHSLNRLWNVLIYGLILLTAIFASIEYVICGVALYPVVFAIAALIAVFVFDIILSILAKHPEVVAYRQQKIEERNAPKESIFVRLKRHAVKPAEPKIEDLTELREVIKSFKLKKKKK